MDGLFCVILGIILTRIFAKPLKLYLAEKQKSSLLVPSGIYYFAGIFKHMILFGL